MNRHAKPDLPADASGPAQPEGAPIMAEQINPLKEVANSVGVAWAALQGVVSAGVTFGFMTVTQATALDELGVQLPMIIMALGTLIGGLLPLISGVVTAFRTVAAGKDHVTPVLNPMDNEGNKLVPVVLAPAVGSGLKVGDF